MTVTDLERKFTALSNKNYYCTPPFDAIFCVLFTEKTFLEITF